jgi:hypothetical protein
MSGPDISTPGAGINFAPNSRTDAVEVAESAGLARKSAIRAMIDLLFQDTSTTGIKRAAFRYFSFCPIPTTPSASMAVKLLNGSAIVNSLDDMQGDWLVVRCPGENSPVFAAAHPTLDRYDILVLKPYFLLADPIAREFRDPATGNIYTADSAKYAIDHYDLEIIEGTPGDPDPGVTRLDAYTIVAAGKVPVAVVRVQAAATEIALADIQDVRELAVLKQIPDDYDVPADAIAQLGGIIPALGVCHPHRATDATGVTNIPINTIFLDESVTPSILKYRKPDTTIVDLH